MKPENYIAISNLCMHYQVEPSFFMQIEAHDLIRIETFNEAQYISMDTIQEVETMVRLCQELNIHEENIDIVFNLLKKIESLQQELKETRSQLNAVRFEAEE